MADSIVIDGKNVKMIYTTKPNRDSYVLVPAGKTSEFEAVFFFGQKDISGFEYEREGKNLVIKNDDQTVVLTDYFTKVDSNTTSSRLQTIRYGSNVSASESVSIIDGGIISSMILNYSPVVVKNTVDGTDFSDTINMSEYENKKGKGLTINAGKGSDVITGTQYNDTIIGGEGANTINFDFWTPFGKDTIKLTPNETLILNITYAGNPLDFDGEYLKHVKVGNDLVMRYCDATSNEIIIKDYFKGGSASETAKVYVGEIEIGEYISENEYLNIEGKGKIYGTNFRDFIKGSAKNDTIYAYAGDDTIDTKGGKDTVVLTGNYGHDVIDSTGSSKVTVKLSSFDSDNISLDENDLVYTTDDKSDFTYKNFLADTSADLWVSANKKNYHITAESGAVVDYSKSKSNDVVILNSDDAQTFKGSKKGTNFVYSDGQAVTFNHNGANDTYISAGDTDDVYTTKLTKSTHLVINDNGGADSLKLNNKNSELALFYNVDKSGNTSDDLVIYNRKAMSYSAIAKSVKSDSYAGLKIENYFTDGNMETVETTAGEIDVEGWKYFVNIAVVDFLNSHDKESVKDVFLNGTKKEKSELTSIFKSTTYDAYRYITESSSKYTDIELVNNNNVLEIYRKGESGERQLLYSPIADFLGTDTNEKLQLLVTDDDGRLMTMSVDSDMAVTYELGNNNTLIYAEDSEMSKLTTANGSSDTLIFTDKDYADFYTKESETVAYNAGDPLIAKSGNDLVIGDVTVKNVDGLTAEINIVDKQEKTKTIIIGKDDINGTFESEIIIGSNGVDIINSNGGNDLIYLGAGNDILNMTTEEKGTPTGKNTAEMVGIGGTHTISNDLDVPAISVYSASGDDTYNTTLKDYGLYIEDYAGNDTVNIQYSDDNLMYFFDVVNPNHANEHPVFYEDLMICDKSQFTTAGASILSTASGKGIKALMEDLQGSFGYVWIDDHFGNTQEIENINIINADGEATALSVDTEIAQTQAKIAGWLAGTNPYFKASGDYDTAWDVIEKGTTMDRMSLLAMYTGNI